MFGKKLDYHAHQSQYYAWLLTRRAAVVAVGQQFTTGNGVMKIAIEIQAESPIALDRSQSAARQNCTVLNQERRVRGWGVMAKDEASQALGLCIQANDAES